MMKSMFRKTAVIAGIICSEIPNASAQQPSNIRNDTFNSVQCAGFNIYYTQVDVDCPAWKGDINISNKAGHLINRHHNITCNNLLEVTPKIERGKLILIKKYISVINDNEKISANAYKQCDANIASKAQFNELSAFDQIDRIIAGVGTSEPDNKTTADSRDAMIEASPYTEKVKRFGKAANLLTDPETSENVKAWFSDFANDREYTVVYSVSQALEKPFTKVLDEKEFANQLTHNGPTTQEQTINNLADAVPKIVTNYITTLF